MAERAPVDRPTAAPLAASSGAPTPSATGARQLTLALRFQVSNGFDQFVATTETAPLVHALRAWLTTAEGIFYIAGAPGTGRSHLLHAAAEEAGGWVLPLADLVDAEPMAVLDGLERVPLLCLDDIDAVAHRSDWAEALFGLFNAVRDLGGGVLVSARASPAALDCALPDLQSRLAWGGCWRLAALDDEGRARLLRDRAAGRGLSLPDEVVSYLLSHFSRRAEDLLGLLEKLDDTSLVTKRRITVPLLRELIETERQSASPSHMR